MTNFYLKQLLVTSFLFLSSVLTFAQQVPNPSFEDWSGEKFDGDIQPVGGIMGKDHPLRILKMKQFCQLCAAEKCNMSLKIDCIKNI